MVDNRATIHNENDHLTVWSEGEWKVETGSQASPIIPMKVGAGRDSNDYNKVWIKPYDDSTGKSGTIGLPRRFIPASGTAYTDEKRGYMWRNRDCALMYEGIKNEILFTNTGALSIGTELAPHPSGCQLRASGMALLGTSLSYRVDGDGTGYIKVRVKVRDVIE